MFRTQSRLQHSPLRGHQLEQKQDQRSDKQDLQGRLLSQDELEHRDAGAEEACEQVGNWACSWGRAVGRGAHKPLQHVRGKSRLCH